MAWDDRYGVLSVTVVVEVMGVNQSPVGLCCFASSTTSPVTEYSTVALFAVN